MTGFDKLINLFVKYKIVLGEIYLVPAAPNLIKYKIISAQVDLNKSDVTKRAPIRNDNI